MYVVQYGQVGQAGSGDGVIFANGCKLPLATPADTAAYLALAGQAQVQVITEAQWSLHPTVVA